MFIRKLSPLKVDTRSDNLQVFVVAEAIWSSHAGLSVNRHKWLFPRSDNLQIFVVAKAFWPGHARLSVSAYCIILGNFKCPA